jgi:Abnormal spindle-like microcephaly-assoc'd, ASPM-SPD-2-Hydin
MRVLRQLSLGLVLAMGILHAPRAAAYSGYFTDNCASCHGGVSTCNGCHAHGTHSSSSKSDVNVSGTLAKTSYAPGETVSVTVNGGYRNGWVRVVLFDQGGTELARSSCPGGMGGCTTSQYPVTLTAKAPSTGGTYAWTVAWYGNEFDAGGASFGSGTSTTIRPGYFTPDANNPNHGYQAVALQAFTVTAPASATIALQPTSLSFGNVNVGTTGSLTAQVRNTGNATLTISNLQRCVSPATSAEYTWSPTALPITIAAGGTANLAVAYAPTAAGTDTGCIALTSNASNGPTTNLAVSGTGVVPAAPRIAVAPTSLAFGNVTIGNPTSATFTISNTGTATLTGSVARASGTSAEYAASPASFSVAPGLSQVVTVTYGPVDTTTDTGALAVASNDQASPSVRVALSGTGLNAPAPGIALNPTALTFGTVTTGGSASLPVRVQNPGTASLSVTQIARCANPATSAEFTWSPAAPFTVAAGGSTTVTVTYTPTAAGADTGCIAFSSNATGTPVVSLDVSGAGQLPAAPRIAVAPTSLAFGNVTVGSSGAKTFTISNTGNATLTGAVARAFGTSAEYGASPASFSVAAGSSQTVTVTYAPADTSTDSGALAVTSNDTLSPTVQVGVSGAGVAAPTPAIALNPSSLALGTVTPGSSASLTAQVRNPGTASLDVTAIALCAGTSAEFSWAPAAPFSVAPGQSATLTVTYRPTAEGLDSGCLALSSNDPASRTVNLGVSGTGTAQAVATIVVDPGAIDFGTVIVGNTASRTTAVRNTGNATLDVTGISLCSGTPATFAWSPTAPFSVLPGASATLTVTYAPAVVGAESGCLAVASNDGAHPAVQLVLAGTGAPPPVPSADLDIDIVRLDVPKAASPKVTSITPTIDLVNPGAVSGAATARLVGTIDGVTVYDKTIPAELAAGAQGTFSFPPVVFGGDKARARLLWTATVADQDPDVDEATATTSLSRGILSAGDYVIDGGSAGSSGCSSAGASAGWLALTAVVLAVLRRRGRGHADASTAP